jgi:dTDP-4-amino-4,6-dideoxygalactose transaminase
MANDAQPVPFLDLRLVHDSLKAELLQVAASVIESARFIGGDVVVGFENEFARYTGAAFAVGVSSGTDALRLALLALGVGPGQRVLTVPNTFIATAAAVSHIGARVDFVDVDPVTCLLDPNRLEELLRRRFTSASKEARPTAIIPVHLYGQCADMDPILALARRYGLKVLEDAAQAHGASYKGRPAGTLGDAAAFSFYPGKNLGACGDAGAVTTDCEAVADTVRILRDHGQRQKYIHLVEGYNGRLDALQAAFLRVKLRYLDAWNAARRRVAASYDVAFADLPAVRPVRVRDGNQSAHHLYVIHARDRDALRERLHQRGIMCSLHYPIPLHLQACYARLAYRRGDFPCAEWSADHVLSLPLFPGISSDQVQRVINAIKAVSGSGPLREPPALLPATFDLRAAG